MSVNAASTAEEDGQEARQEERRDHQRPEPVVDSPEALETEVDRVDCEKDAEGRSHEPSGRLCRDPRDQTPFARRGPREDAHPREGE